MARGHEDTCRETMRKNSKRKSGNRAYFAPPAHTSQVRNLVMGVLTLGLKFDALLRTPQQINACAGRARLFRGYSNSFKVRAIALTRSSLSATTLPGSNFPSPLSFPPPIPLT